MKNPGFIPVNKSMENQVHIVDNLIREANDNFLRSAEDIKKTHLIGHSDKTLNEKMDYEDRARKDFYMAAAILLKGISLKKSITEKLIEVW